MKIALTPKRRRKHEALAEEQIEWPKFFFLDRPDMTYINLEAKRSCARWKSRGIVGVTNGQMNFADKFDKFSFTTMYHIFKSY